MSSGSSYAITPVTQNPKKRELTSPDFDIESKKNKTVSQSLDTSVGGTMASDPVEVMDTHSIPPAGPTFTIPPSEMLKLSDLLKDTFRGEIVGLVDNIVTGVLKGLQERITTLEESNQNLLATNKSLTARVAVLESQADQAEKYGRRNCLRISGIPEETGENTDNLVLKIADDIEADVRPQDIDRSHRVGNPKRKKATPREIIVKFSTYRARANLYRQRTLMKERGHEGEFINEDLTKKRNEYLCEARKLFKSKNLKGAWSSDGTILVKDNGDNVHRIMSLNDLVPFGYVPPAPRPAVFIGPAAGAGAPVAGSSATD